MRWISWDSLALAAICLADTVVTTALLATGRFAEANPLLAYYLRWGLWAMVGVKLLTFVVPIVVAEWYRRRNPGLVAKVVRVTIALYIALYATAMAAVNLRIVPL